MPRKLGRLLSRVAAPPAFAGATLLMAYGLTPYAQPHDRSASAVEDPDRIVLLHNIVKSYQPPPVPETVVLVNANSPADGGCLKHARTHDLQFLNLVAGGACGPDEIVVFSVDNPVTVDRGDGGSGEIWTSAANETREVDLVGAAPKVPLIIGIAEEQTSDGQLVSQLVTGDIATANIVFNRQRAGFRVFRARTKQVWQPAPAAAIGRGCPGTLPAQYFRPDTINVYYVSSLDAAATLGVQCRDADWNAIYISVAARNDNTLAHELGHAFGLEHTGGGSSSWYTGANNQQLLQPNNLMWADSQVGTAVTLGQVFRINLDAISVLHRNGIRGEPALECECRIWNGGCERNDGAKNRRKYLVQSDLDGICPRITRGWQ